MRGEGTTRVPRSPAAGFASYTAELRRQLPERVARSSSRPRALSRSIARATCFSDRSPWS